MPIVNRVPELHAIRGGPMMGGRSQASISLLPLFVTLFGYPNA